MFLGERGRESINLPQNMPTTSLGLTIWSYRIRWQQRRCAPAFPLWESPLDVIDHCAELGCPALQTGVDDWSQELAHQVRARCETAGIALEGQIELPETDDLERFERSLIAGKAAGATIFRAYCSLERRYERFSSRDEWERWRASAVTTLQRVEPILARHGVQLAVENHKDWNAPEQAEVFRRLSSEWIGICLDFGNNLSLLEDPLEVAETLAPWILTTHVKDMGLRTAPDGFLLSEVPLGQGILDLPALVKVCRAANPRIRFLLEMITRDPLRIPCLTEAYGATFADFQDQALQRTMDLARHSDEARVELPHDSDQTDEEALGLEERLIRESLDWWRRKAFS